MDRKFDNTIDSLNNNLLDSDWFHDNRRYLLRHNDGYTNDSWESADRDYVTRRSDIRNGRKRTLSLLPLLLLPLILFGVLAFNTLQDATENNRALQTPQGEVGVGGGPDTTVSPTPIQSITPTPVEESLRTNTVVPGIGGSGDESNIVPTDSPDVGYGTI